MKTEIHWTAWYFDSDARAAAEAAMRAETAAILTQVAPGYLYVAEFASGIVKIGRTAQPAVRLTQHAAAARPHGGEVLQTWVSRRHFYCRASEADLIRLCGKSGERAGGREYFRMPFRTARSLARICAENRMAFDDEPEMAALWQAGLDDIPEEGS